MYFFDKTISATVYTISTSTFWIGTGHEKIQLQMQLKVLSCFLHKMVTPVAAPVSQPPDFLLSINERINATTNGP